MKFLSSTQAAGIWGISPRRVALLASQGRIEGAVFAGNTWLIPDDAPKPADSRRKEVKEQRETPDPDNYPFLLFTVNSEEQLNSLTSEEKALYRACELHEYGDFDGACEAAAELLPSCRASIRFGAIYLLALSFMYKSDFAAAEKYALLFKTEYSALESPPLAIRLLFSAVNMEMGQSSASMESDALSGFSACSCGTKLLPFILYYKLYIALMKFFLDGTLPDLSLCEALCLLADLEGWSYTSMLFHSTLSLFYYTLGNSDAALPHAKRAIDTGIRRGFYLTVSTLLSNAPDITKTLGGEYPEEVMSRIRRMAETVNNVHIGYAEYLHKTSVLSKLRADDYRLISYCLRNYSIADIAASFGLSRSGINRRLANLYAKLGVTSRKELKKVYVESIIDFRS